MMNILQKSRVSKFKRWFTKLSEVYLLSWVNANKDPLLAWLIHHTSSEPALFVITWSPLFLHMFTHNSPLCHKNIYYISIFLKNVVFATTVGFKIYQLY